MQWHVLAPDLRNHGRSFHDEEVGVAAMTEDLRDWMDRMEMQSVVLCGHSLGGKIAMRFANDFPEAVTKLVVVDIAPRDYPPEHHLPTLEALLSLELDGLSSRKDADLLLREKIPNWGFRQFLLTNLEQDESRLHWKPNLAALNRGIAKLSVNPLGEEDHFEGPCLFVRGGKSGYLRSEHLHLVDKYFTSARVEVLENAGHDVHVEDREGFLRVLQSFIGD